MDLPTDTETSSNVPQPEVSETFVENHKREDCDEGPVES